MSTKIIFIRHGESTANKNHVFGGNTDCALTEIGIIQAKRVATFIEKTYKIDAVYASTLQRAYRTAEIISDLLCLSVSREERLNEIYGGIWDGMTFKDIKRKYPEKFALWNRDLSLVQPPEGENVREIQKRAFSAVCDIASSHENQTVIIVAHRVVIRTLQCLWENRPIHEINQCAWISNCSVSEVIFDNGELIPIRIGQDAFMGNVKTVGRSEM